MNKLIINPLTKQTIIVNDCGTGSGGFKAGNTCAKGGFSVRKLQPEEVIEEVTLPSGKTIGHKAPKSTTYGVFDSAGKVVKTKSLLKGMPDIYEMHPTKVGAEKAAKRFQEAAEKGFNQ